jgi:hypothetical protein
MSNPRQTKNKRTAKARTLKPSLRDQFDRLDHLLDAYPSLIQRSIEGRRRLVEMNRNGELDSLNKEAIQAIERRQWAPRNECQSAMVEIIKLLLGTVGPSPKFYVRNNTIFAVGCEHDWPEEISLDECALVMIPVADIVNGRASV